MVPQVRRPRRRWRRPERQLHLLVYFHFRIVHKPRRFCRRLWWLRDNSNNLLVFDPIKSPHFLVKVYHEPGLRIGLRTSFLPRKRSATELTRRGVVRLRSPHCVPLRGTCARRRIRTFVAVRRQIYSLLWLTAPPSWQQTNFTLNSGIVRIIYCFRSWGTFWTLWRLRLNLW